MPYRRLFKIVEITKNAEFHLVPFSPNLSETGSKRENSVNSMRAEGVATTPMRLLAVHRLKAGWFPERRWGQDEEEPNEILGVCVPVYKN